MKNNLWKTIVIALLGAFSLVSCSDDDKTNIGNDLDGHYKSKAAYEIRSASFYTLSQNFTVTKVNGNHINILLESLPELRQMGSNIGLKGDVEIPNVEVIQQGDIYALKSEQTVNNIPITLMGYANDKAINFTLFQNSIEVTVTTSGNSEGKKYPLGLTLAGTKMTGNESSEARITEFKFDTSKDGNKNVIAEQPVIDEANKVITFKVKAGAKVNKLIPTITVAPESAWVYPAGGTTMDLTEYFEEDYDVVFTAVAEDGTRIPYSLKILVEEPVTE